MVKLYTKFCTHNFFLLGIFERSKQFIQNVSRGLHDLGSMVNPPPPEVVKCGQWYGVNPSYAAFSFSWLLGYKHP